MQPSDTYKEIGRYMGVAARSQTVRKVYSLVQERRMSDWNEEQTPYTLQQYAGTTWPKKVPLWSTFAICGYVRILLLRTRCLLLQTMQPMYDLMAATLYISCIFTFD